MATVLPFERPAFAEPLAYALGVPPFDRSNPAHVRAWNTLVSFGASQRRFEEKEARESAEDRESGR